jgi:ABC-2 type transport system ATP-binding protein
VISNTDPTAITVKVSGAAAAAEVLSALSRQSIQLSDFSLGTPSLDDVFFTLTGRPSSNEPADPGQASPGQTAARAEGMAS